MNKIKNVTCGLLVSVMIYKELGSCHCCPSKLKINTFSCIHQKTTDIGQTVTLKSGKIATSREIQQTKICLPGTEGAGAINS